MTVEKIPNLFWYSVSVAILVFTFGFMIISFRSGDVSLKFKDLEIKANGVMELDYNLSLQKENLDAQAKTIALREESISELEDALTAKIDELNLARRELNKLNDQLAALEASGISGGSDHLVEIADATSASLEVFEASLDANAINNEKLIFAKGQLAELGKIQKEQQAELQVRQEVIEGTKLKTGLGPSPVFQIRKDLR